jgi:hypothetical protein
MQGSVINTPIDQIYWMPKEREWITSPNLSLIYMDFKLVEVICLETIFTCASSMYSPFLCSMARELKQGLNSKLVLNYENTPCNFIFYFFFLIALLAF